MAGRNPRARPVARPRTRKPARPMPAGDTVPEIYSGKTGVLLATGPSLSKEDVEYLRPLHARGSIILFGLNDAYKLCDFLDVLYFCDPRWLLVNKDVLDYQHAQIWTQDLKVRREHKNVKRIAGGSGNGICKTPNHIHFGGNSGFQLLNLAWHFGIREFYLLGYNMGMSPRMGKQQHFFGQHPKPLNQSNNYKSFVSSFQAIDKATRSMITNCTHPTGLGSHIFQQKQLRKALPHNEKTRHIPDEPEAREATRPSEEAATIKAVSGNGRRTNLQEPDSRDHCDRTIPVEITTRPDLVPTYGG